MNPRAALTLLALVVCGLLIPVAVAGPPDTVNFAGDADPSTASSGPGVIASLPGGAVLVSLNDGVHGQELWQVDGTPAGTFMLSDINPGTGNSAPSKPVPGPGGLYWFIATGPQGRELYTYDRVTHAVTLKEVNPGPGDGVSGVSQTPVYAGTNLFFIGSDSAHGQELWKTDGTTSAIVKDIANGTTSSSVASITALGSKVVFGASDGTNGLEPWVSDGTGGGTVILKDLNTTPGAGSIPGGFTVVAGGTVVFGAFDGSASHLYATGGVANDVTIPTGSPASQPLNLRSIGGLAYFRASDPTNGAELWKTNGTTASLVKDVNPGTANALPAPLGFSGTTFYFVADDGTHGGELWKTNATGTDATLVKDIRPGSASSALSDGAPLGSGFVFRADDGSGAGKEVWLTDGSGAGTQMIKDVFPDPESGGAEVGADVMAASAGIYVYFNARDGHHGTELYRTDGSAENTGMMGDLNTTDVSSQPKDFAALGDKTVFTATTQSTGRELFISDGTTSSLLSDIQPGVVSSVPDDLVSVPGAVLFSAGRAGVGSEVWRTDGTTAGTTAIDLVPGASGSDPDALVAGFDGAVFRAKTPSDGAELFRTDGTLAGTVPITDVSAPGTGIITNLSEITVAGDHVYFVYENALYVTTGTPGSTTRLQSLASGEPTGVRSLLAVGTGVFFSGTDAAAGRELWHSDGTLAGTKLVADIAPGPGFDSSPTLLGRVGSTAYLSADDGPHGEELWKSDGTGAGTALVTDLYPGSDSSSPQQGGADVGGRFVFAATQDSLERLYATDGTAAGTVLLTTGPEEANADSNGAYAVSIGGRGYFQSADGASGIELGVTDGTAAGTGIVEVRPGVADASPDYLTDVAGTLWFSATDDAHGEEPWRMLDTTAPDTTITSGPAAGAKVVAADVKFGFAATGAVGSFECRLDGAAFAPCSGPGASHVPAAALGLGAHTFEVRAVDPPGPLDATPASRSFTVVAAVSDADGDGVVGAADKCPTLKGTKASKGCPNVVRKVTLKLKKQGRRSKGRQPGVFSGAISTKKSRCRSKQTVSIYQDLKKDRRIVKLKTGTKGTFKSKKLKLKAGRYYAKVTTTYVATTGACAAATSKRVRA